MARYIQYFLCSITALLLITSCKTKMTGMKELATRKEVSELFGKAPRFDTFTSQVQINANGMSAKGDLRIVKNKTIYLSIQAFLGIEVARLKITPDSIIALDRIHRRFVAESFTNIRNSSSKGLNFFVLQALFTNSLFLFEKDSLALSDISSFEWSKNGEGFVLIPRKSQNCKFFLNKNQQLSQTILSGNSEKLNMEWSYSNFTKLNTSVFPQTMEILFTSATKKLNGSMQFGKIESGKSFSTECIIPQRYAKVNLDDILKMFTEL